MNPKNYLKKDMKKILITARVTAEQKKFAKENNINISLVLRDSLDNLKKQMRSKKK